MRLFVLGFAVACVPQPDESCVHSFYADADGDGHGVPAASATGCIAPPGYETTHDDCDDRDDAIHPGSQELCNGIDDDCDGAVDVDAADLRTSYVDRDGDGYGRDATGVESCDVAADRLLVGGDCDDGDPAIRPGAEENCNDTDDDCDGEVDDDPIDIPWYVDVDDDGWGGAGPGATGCEVPVSAVLVGGDCDDHDETVRPDADELCNELDDDCDALIDVDDPDLVGEYYYLDDDGDGYGDDATGAFGCLGAGWVEIGDDCDDGSAAIHPGVSDACDGIDDDCDGLDGASGSTGVASYYRDADGDGFGDSSLGFTTSCGASLGYTTRTGGDCADDDPQIQPDAIEWCDGIDNDCSGTVDDHIRYTDWFPDADGDGYGDADGETVFGCEPVGGYAIGTPDCDDTTATIFPGAAETCANTADDDCDSVVDNCSMAVADSDFHLAGPIDLRSPVGSTVDAGDLDADGVADLVVGAPGPDPRVVLFRGPPSGRAILDDADLSFTASAASLGGAVAVSDADGDDDDDLLLGIPGHDGAYLFLGPLTAGGDVSTGDAALLASGYAGVGDAVAILSDHDGDGTPDVAVDARARARGMGLVFVASGPTSGTIDLTTEGTYVYRSDWEGLGHSFASVGDTTGDGVDDLAIGAPSEHGSAVVVIAGGAAHGTYATDEISIATFESGTRDRFGESIDATDYDGDGYSDLFVGAPDTRSGSVYGFLGPFTAGRSTWDADVRWFRELGLGASVAVGGDVDADGQPDVLIGALSDTDGAGSVFLQIGVATGTVRIEDLRSFHSTSASALGYAVTFVPDWTGDGGSEVALGQPYIPTGGDVASSGSVDVFNSENLY